MQKGRETLKDRLKKKKKIFNQMQSKETKRKRNCQELRNSKKVNKNKPGSNLDICCIGRILTGKIY